MSDKHASKTGAQLLREAADWSGNVRESFWDGWRPEAIVALYYGWSYHEHDEYPDTASNVAVQRALDTGRRALRNRRAT